MKLAGSEQPLRRRLPYEKPVLRSISLVADQVLGVGCKSIPNYSNPLPGEPSLGCVTNSCLTILGT
jgi:hypothetical protein